MPLATSFDLAEAEALIAVLATLEGPTPPLAMPPLPADWTLVFDSPVLGAFDNKWQLWRSAGDPPKFAVVIRGTVAKARSILADVLSVMIRGSGSLAVDSLRFSYRFAADPQATVHLGFALAALILLHDPRDGILPGSATRARPAATCSSRAIARALPSPPSAARTWNTPRSPARAGTTGPTSSRSRSPATTTTDTTSTASRASRPARGDSRTPRTGCPRCR